MQFVDLKRQYRHYQTRIDRAISRVLERSQFINGPEVGQLEEALGQYVGREAIAVGSGTEALQISLMSLGIGAGDEVIPTPFTWISPAESIALVGAKPVFVDIEPDTFNIDSAKIERVITSKTKAIIPVSLFGQMADYPVINQMAKKHGIAVIEDAAQSFGAEQEGVKSGGATPLAITSFFPAKPLGCYGDGGCVFAESGEVAERVRAIRNHGSSKRCQHTCLGMTGRLDTMQAAVLLAKWPDFEQELEERRRLAAQYNEALQGVCTVPIVKLGNAHIYAQYTICTPKRDALVEALGKAEIPYGIYYPTPLYKQPVFDYLGYHAEDFPNSEAASCDVISLPLHPWLSEEEQESIIAVVRQVCREN